PYDRLSAGRLFDIIQYSIIFLLALTIYFPFIKHIPFIDLPWLLFERIPALFAILIFIDNLVKHFILRFCFYIEGVMPLRLVAFLDYAHALRLIECDGGHWRFRHQNLQDYFYQAGLQ
ncbi:MAG: hypothetical protein RLZZ292_3591, partial [Bacteroidota bacterium]